MRISEHISYKEGCGSPTARRLGIDNTPTEEQLKALLETFGNEVV